MMAGQRSLPIAKIGVGTCPLLWRSEELLEWHHFFSVLSRVWRVKRKSSFFCPRNTRRNAKERGSTDSIIAGKRSLPIAKIEARTLPLLWRSEELLEWHHFFSVLSRVWRVKRKSSFSARETREETRKHRFDDSWQTKPSYCQD